jgi:hypothetical protein
MTPKEQFKKETGLEPEKNRGLYIKWLETNIKLIDEEVKERFNKQIQTDIGDDKQ